MENLLSWLLANRPTAITKKPLRITTEEKQKLQSGFQGQRGGKTELFKTRLEVFRKEKVPNVNKEVRDKGRRQSLD